MFDLKQIRETAMRKGMELVSDPRLMKLLSDPRVMRVVMKAMELRGVAMERLASLRARVTGGGAGAGEDR